MSTVKFVGTNLQDLMCYTTDLVNLKPNITNLTLEQTGTSCYVINATNNPHTVDSIWVWYGTDWAKY